MQNCVNCQKKIIIKLITSILDLKASEMAEGLNLSSSTVYKYLAGERNSVEMDIYLIERLFAIKIKDYSRNGRI